MSASARRKPTFTKGDGDINRTISPVKPATYMKTLFSRDDIGVMPRSLSVNLKGLTYKPEIMDHQMMLRSETRLIKGEGIVSCQLTRTYGLLIYALKDLGRNISLDNPQDIEMLQRIMKLIYPDQNLFGVPDKPLFYRPVVARPDALEYLQGALTFSCVSDVKYPNCISVNEASYAEHFHRDYFSKIRTFAIIKNMFPDGEYPIHYFNVVMSEELNKICCYSSWGAISGEGSISVPLRRFPITYDLLTNMNDLIVDMIYNNDTTVQATLTGYASVEDYKRSLGPIENLYIVELLNEDGTGPLVDTVAHVLRDVDPPLAAAGPGGASNKNKKRTRKQSSKRTKRSRGRTNKRTTRRKKNTYKKR